MFTAFAVLVLLVTVSNGFSLPFSFSFKQLPLTFKESSVHRVAIIGSGAAGSSSAFWLARAQNRSNIELEVDIFDALPYIGGRSTTVYPYDSRKYKPVELGASIFVKANQNMFRAVEEFNLTTKDYGDDERELGIWDGERFRFRLRSTGLYRWWDTAKLLLRYGFNSPRRADSLVKSLIESYLTLVHPNTLPWRNISEISDRLNFSSLIGQTTAEYLDSQGISKLYSREIIEAMTRVNYGQNVDAMHALEGQCSQAANGARSVVGGNYQIFEQFIKRSNAKVFLNTTVTSLTRAGKAWTLHTEGSNVTRTYDSIIIAAPFHLSGITISPSPKISIPSQPYVHLHVTLLTTTSPNPLSSYFSMSDDDTMPDTVLTSYEGARAGGKAPEFNSLSISAKGDLSDSPDEKEHIVKLFSKKQLSDEWLRSVFGEIGWVFRKEWDAYPRLPPMKDDFAPIQPDDGLYYVNGMEAFISTMDTATVASQNVVELLLTDVFGPNITTCWKDEMLQTAGVMKGWDC